jgi:hypothetical protein
VNATTTEAEGLCPDTLAARCPQCSRRIRIPFYRSATTVHQRTCRKCRTFWHVVVKPVDLAPKMSAKFGGAGAAWAHVLTWTATERRTA